MPRPGKYGTRMKPGDGEAIVPMEPPVFKKMSQEDSDKLMQQAVKTAGKTGHKVWTDAMITIRRQALIDLYAQGYTRREIVVEIMDRWGCGEVRAYEWIKDALAWLQEGNDEFREYNRDKQIEKLETLAKRAKDAGDFRSAVMATSEVNKLLGLNEQKVTVDIERVFKFDGD